jgi:hypothetical protein
VNGYDHFLHACRKDTELKKFRKLVTGKLVEFWSDTKDIKLALMNKLAEFALRDELVGWVPGDQVTNTGPLVEEFARLTKENSELKKELAKGSESHFSFMGLDFEQSCALLSREQLLLDSQKDGQEETSSILTTMGRFGDTFPSVLHALWVKRRELLLPKSWAVRAEGFQRQFFDALLRMGIMEEDQRSASGAFRLSDQGRAFILRLQYEKGPLIPD